MFILGSMIQLDSSTSRIPVPWWHRASLGFETGTQVFVSVTEPERGRPGDLIVSVLDPNRWDQHVAVSCLSEDQPGVIDEALTGVHAWNIALAETVTVESGKIHHVDLICEPYPPGDFPDDRITNLKDELSRRFKSPSVRRFPSLNTKMCWSRLGEIQNGWVTFPTHLRQESWRDELARQLRDIGGDRQFDTEKLVLSGDTTTRIFRAVVPRRGAVMVEIEHADEPRVLGRLTKCLRESDVNVLSTLLKRGGAAAKNAVLVAACEPMPNASSPDLAKTIESALKELPQQIRPAWRISDGVLPDGVIYSHHPDDAVARVPNHLRARVLERRSQSVGLRVFLSRRFLSDGRSQEYAKKIREVLAANNCAIIEAEVLPGGTSTSLDEVSAAMWAAQAGIVLGVEPMGQTDVAFSLNLAHEFGFMHGQGKPLLLLIEAPSRVEKELDTWSNLKGITAPRFSKDSAFIDDHKDSISSNLLRWLSRIRAQNSHRHVS